MPDLISIPIQVYGLGFILSLGIAFLIKGMLFTIRFLSKEKKES